MNEKGDMSGITTTSGLAFKLPGRCGDSPIIGAGCYTDQDVGSAGATGSGEENIKVAGAHTIVENMRHGMSPQEAGMDALKRIVRNYNGDMNKLRFMDMIFYALRKDGAYAAVLAGLDLVAHIHGRGCVFAHQDHCQAWLMAPGGERRGALRHLAAKLARKGVAVDELGCHVRNTSQNGR